MVVGFVPSSPPLLGWPGFPAENPHACARRAGIMRHYRTTNASAPAVSHSASMYVKFPTSNTVCRIRVWTVTLLTGKLQALVMVKKKVVYFIEYALLVHIE